MNEISFLFCLEFLAWTAILFDKITPQYNRYKNAGGCVAETLWIIFFLFKSYAFYKLLPMIKTLIKYFI